MHPLMCTILLYTYIRVLFNTGTKKDDKIDIYFRSVYFFNTSMALKMH